MSVDWQFELRTSEVKIVILCFEERNSLKRFKMSVSEESTKRVCTSSPIHFSVDENPGQSVEESEEGRSCTEIETQNHPLFNDVILRNVFDHVRRSDLLACRGVCKKWNVATLPFTRLAFKITVYKNRDNTVPSSDGVNGIYSESDLKNRAKEHSHTVDNFVELLSSNALGIPFGKFTLEDFSTTDGDGQKFIELCGNTIHEISFIRGTFKMEDILELLKSTPKLKSFIVPDRISCESGNDVKILSRLSHLKTISIGFDPEYLCSLTLVEEILSAAPNISNVILSEGHRDNPEDNYTSLNILRLIVKLGRVSSIETLYLSLVRSEHAAILTAQENPFKLKKLGFATYKQSVDLIKFITFFKNTLRDLSVHLTDINTLMGFPRMPYLKQLYLGFNSTYNPNTRCVNLDKIFPVLEKLNFYGFNVFDKQEEFFPESNPCLTLKSLHLETFYFAFNGFKNIQTIFPNLTELNLKFSLDGPETLTHIWGQMTQLEILTLDVVNTKMDDWELDLDSAFTGISTQGFLEIGGVVSELEGKTETLRRETIHNIKTQYSQSPSITNLTKLRSVKLGVIGYVGGTDYYEDISLKYLTDLTLYFGLYSMKSLKQIVVKTCKFTNTGCKILVDDMGLESGEFEYAVDHPAEPTFRFSIV